MGKRKQHKQRKQTARWYRRYRRPLMGVGGLLLLLILYGMTEYESFASLYDAEYTGAEKCGECHTITYEDWEVSPHANMTRKPAGDTVVGDFDNGSWTLPVSAQLLPGDDQPAAKMYEEDGRFYMALRHPQSGDFIPFEISYVIGYQYRQTYLTEEAGGVLRRLPLQWSQPQQAFFPYWNMQEESTPSVADLWAQMQSQNSAWNLFCARCHTTHLVIESKDQYHTQADTHWTDEGIACEACHGPGSQHVNYFEHNYVNRIAAFANSQLRGEPAAYIANGPKLTKGEDLSVCARCHGPDISMANTEIYRTYEPGYSEAGKINDLSPYFKSMPLEPGRTAPTVEVWEDGRPKGIGMLFRSFIESAHYEGADVRCYDCHDAHNNKAPAAPGLLEASAESNQFCIDCHTDIDVAEHSFHDAGTEGSFCYDCHMPRSIMNLVSGVPRWTRTHTLSSIPDPAFTHALGYEQSPNACNECHQEEGAEWAVEWMVEWWE